MRPRLFGIANGAQWPHILRTVSSPITRSISMWLGVAAVLILLWVYAYFLSPMGGMAIHLLLVIGIVSLIYHFMKGKPTPPA